MNLNFRAFHHVLVLGNRVGHHHGFEVAAVEFGQSLAAKDAVGQDGVDLGRPVLQQFLRGVDDSPAGVRHVVDQDGHLPSGVPNQHHACHLGANFFRYLNIIQIFQYFSDISICFSYLFITNLGKVSDFTSLAFFLSL